MSLSRAAAALIVAAILAAPVPAAADQTDPRLGALFAQLKTADSEEQARPLMAQIWAIWGKSGNPEVDSLMAIGTQALAASDGVQALAAFDQVVAMAPAFAEGWNKRATTLYLLGRYADSVADIGRVLALEPRHFGALSGLGLCETQRDRLPEAVAAFQRALAVNPNMPDLKVNIRTLNDEIARRSI